MAGKVAADSDKARRMPRSRALAKPVHVLPSGAYPPAGLDLNVEWELRRWGSTCVAADRR
jgi:hypothetical protein